MPKPSVRVTKTINELILREGGYVNHPDDKGGPTRYGVTEKLARRYGYQGDMRDLPVDLAFDIHYNEFAVLTGLDWLLQFKDMGDIFDDMFDTAALMGPQWSIRFLQRALNSFNRKATLYADIKVDGVFGSRSQDALRAYRKTRGVLEQSIFVLATSMACMKGERFIQLCEAREANEEFVFGWFVHRIVL